MRTSASPIRGRSGSFASRFSPQKAKVDYWDSYPAYGPGRVDTFNPYKRLFFDMPVGGLGPERPISRRCGTSGPREGMHLHWDGNNTSLRERNISAAIGAGVVAPYAGHGGATTLDEPSMNRLADWVLDLEPPKFPETKIDKTKLARREQVFRARAGRATG